MAEIDDGGPAFPRPMFANEDYLDRGQDGMSLLDYFAGQALVGILCSPGQYQRADGEPFNLAEAAYAAARDMLAARQKGGR